MIYYLCTFWVYLGLCKYIPTTIYYALQISSNIYIIFIYIYINRLCVFYSVLPSINPILVRFRSEQSGGDDFRLPPLGSTVFLNQKDTCDDFCCRRMVKREHRSAFWRLDTSYRFATKVNWIQVSSWKALR